VCFGAQLLTRVLGAEVTRSEPPEIGWHDVTLTEEGRRDPVLGALPERFCALQWHSWQCALPDGATALATSPVCLQAFRRDRVWAVQFHPETDEATLHRWIFEFRDDPDAVAQGFAPSVALAEARERLPGWHALGRRLFAAWADAVAA
jgi:GMP synthase (glutamine-hydrolysing)